MTPRLLRRTLLALVPVAAVLTAALAAGQQFGSDVPLDKLKLPPGFKISVYAEGIRSARGMTLGDKGTLFVGSMDARQVYAVIDRNGDGVADEAKVVARGLPYPVGVAFRNGSLYVSAVTRIVRIDDIENRLDDPPAPVTVYDGLPNRSGHIWRFIAFGPDGLLYVSVGSPCNVCDEETIEPRFASIVRMKPDGSNLEIFAHGVRDSVGFDWHPVTHELWFTDNGRDELGDDVPNDELNIAPRAGLHFGFPFCHQGDVTDPEFGAKHPCSDFVPPVQKMGPHVAAIGMRFYTGTMFPAEYRNAAFIAQHGSWNRSVPSGYRVMVAKNDGRTVTSYEPFVEGWLQGTLRSSPRGATANTFARPADVLVMRDGSLLVSDDMGGRIYRVTYQK